MPSELLASICQKIQGKAANLLERGTAAKATPSQRLCREVGPSLQQVSDVYTLHTLSLLKKFLAGISLVVQWLTLHAPSAGVVFSILVAHAAWPSQNNDDDDDS